MARRKDSRKLGDVLQLHVQLVGISPPIWRRLLVPYGTTLADLHTLLQHAFSWTDSHLHQFEHGEQAYGPPHPEEPELLDERKIGVAELLTRKRASLLYRYDYGDDWEHLITLEGTVPFDPKGPPPACIGGARACPPEDCGGPHGYELLLEALASPRKRSSHELIAWIGGYWDPEGFDANAVNRAIQRVL
jgi:hypothetical protein